ncbi:MAG: phosphoribosylglycinamide formyltransferase [Anaerolineae bacterium]|nr:phosphoribosylglycinamide formyltransferase [Anaerolineae bacterium]MCO5206166.1 phosphoribosylglycinamide formyltransferase [Anaerolineae bacterium]
MDKARIVVLISGSGSNLQALIDAVGNGTLHGNIMLVVSNRRKAFGLTRAEQASIETLYFPLKPYRDSAAPDFRAQYDTDLARAIEPYAPDVIVLAGWMHILSPAFLDRFPGRVINLHPALPGQFAGTHAIERTFAAFQSGETAEGGCMVHYAIPEIDAGAVIMQEIVPIRPNDTLESFAKRVHEAEHRIIIVATQNVIAKTGKT